MNLIKSTLPIVAASLLSCATFFVAAHAATVTTGCVSATTCTLTELYNGGTITVDDVLFDNFILDDDASASPVNADDVVVSGFTDMGNTGLEFNIDPALTVNINRSFLEYILSFDAAVVAPSLREITSAGLNLVNGGINGDAFLEINAEINGDVLNVFHDSINGAQLLDSLTLANLTMISVAMDWQGEDFDGQSSSFLNTFRFGLGLIGDIPVAEVPLPAALPFMVTGLLGYGATRRKKRS
ncbi:MAG: VPLPA-CTERM sorting domain-containing protein [Parvularculaceae bacterium]